METTRSSYGRSPLRLENPFSLKVAQVFTGFGIGCGVGIGVGRPIYLGAIPALQQVMSAARGATDAFSGVGRHVNGSLKQMGLKSVEVGIGCGIGIGHGFGVGLALKPGVVNQIQNCVGEVMEKIVMNLGSGPVLSSVQGVIPVPGQSSINSLTGTPTGNAQVLSERVPDVKAVATSSSFRHSANDEKHAEETTSSSYASQEIVSAKSVPSRTEKVVKSFLQDPLFSNAETELNEVTGNLHLENIVLQVLLKHQQIIEELIEDNRKLQEILVEDLKVPASKLQTKTNTKIRSYYTCSDCFECRRRRRTRR